MTNDSNLPLGGMGMAAAAAGVLGYWGYMSGAVKPKTVEELQSEVEKWQEQTKMATQAIIDTAMALSGTTRQVAKLNEEARLAKLDQEMTERLLDEAQRENERLKRELATATNALVAIQKRNEAEPEPGR